MSLGESLVVEPECSYFLETGHARSPIFIAFGIMASTTLARYEEGQEVALFLCENGFIAINPPLTKGDWVA